MALTCLHVHVRFNRSYDAFHAARVITGRALRPIFPETIKLGRYGQPSRKGRNSNMMVESERKLAHIPP